MTSLEILSRNVKRLRRAYGYTQESLCDKTGVSEREISKVERMAVDPGTHKLAGGFHLSASELLDEALEIPARPSEKRELKEKLTRELERMSAPEQQMIWEMLESYRRCKRENGVCARSEI